MGDVRKQRKLRRRRGKNRGKRTRCEAARQRGSVNLDTAESCDLTKLN